MESGNLGTFIKGEYTEMTFDLEAKLMNTFKGIGYHSMTNGKTIAKYPNLCAPVKPILQAFPRFHTVESGYHHVYYLLSKQKGTLNVQHDDL